MPISVATVLIIFGILLPSWDVYSDIFFSYTMFNTPHKRWNYETRSYEILGTHMYKIWNSNIDTSLGINIVHFASLVEVRG